jgi:2-polyprenyl-6-methoxyphenol hydroxylase-like FAD-dependent oxidoreductase
MTVALELGSRGIDVVLLEQNTGTTTNPRCNTTNARSMEYFRRFGIANRIRRAGLPLDHPTDMVYTTSLAGYELTRFEFSSAREVLERRAREAAQWPTPEMQHRIAQIYLEPIIDRELARYSSVRVMRGVRFEGATQDDSGVTVTARDVDGETLTFRTQYLVGCDGGASTVRRCVGASLGGDAQVGEKRLTVYLKSDDVTLPPGRPGWRYLWRGSHYHGAVIQLDGYSLYLCHARVPEGEELESADADLAMREAFGRDIRHEKLDVIRWVPRRLVVDRFRTGRVVLAGDAAHVWLPDGGFGMNTGVADGVAIAWRLAAILQGWGTETLLDDYAFERRSIGEATSSAAKTIGTDMLRLSQMLNDPQLAEDSDEGADLRKRAGDLIQDLDRKQWYSMGVQLGQNYAGSPGLAAAAEGAEAGLASIDTYTPSVSPGVRLPHYWTYEPEECVFDLLGQGMSLLAVGADEAEVKRLESLSLGATVPLSVIPLPRDASSVYDRRYVLVRPDMHVAWSGDQLPDGWPALLRNLCGFARVGLEERPESTDISGIDDPFVGTSWGGSV